MTYNERRPQNIKGRLCQQLLIVSSSKNLGPNNNTLGDQVQLGHLRCSKMDLIQILVIFSHKKLYPIIGFICLFQKIKDPNKTASISTWFLNIFLLPTTYQIML